MSKLIDIDAIFDTIEINEADVIEATRRSKISETSRYKMATDVDYQTARRNGALKTAEIRRQIPLADYESIIREYYDPTVKRSYNYLEVIAKRYKIRAGQKLTGQINKITSNHFKTLPDAEYTALRTAWENANPDFRSDMLKDLYKSGKRKPSDGAALSAMFNSVDAVTAQKIYAECLTQADSRTHKNYQRLAKQYNINRWQKVRDIANGNHYNLKHVNAEYDIEQWRLNIGEGNYEMIDPQGNSHLFNTLNELGYFLNVRWGNDTSDLTRNWYTGRNWFEKTQPNTVYTKQKREFKGWKYVNHLPAKTK
jgi:hypothetical protein